MNIANRVCMSRIARLSVRKIKEVQVLIFDRLVMLPTESELSTTISAGGLVCQSYGRVII